MSFTQKKRAEIIAKSYMTLGLKGKKVLDVGCGNGVVSLALKKRLDLDFCGTDTIEYCKAGIPFIKMHQEGKLPFENASFDCVMFNDVLHHTDNPEELLLEGTRLAQEIFIFEDQESRILKFADVWINYFYSSQMPCPLNFKTQTEWVFLFEKLGFDWKEGAISYPWWYPFRHMAFKLTRRKI